MECLIALVVLSLFVAPCVLSGLAWVRTRRAQERIDKLELQMSVLQRQLRSGPLPPSPDSAVPTADKPSTADLQPPDTAGVETPAEPVSVKQLAASHRVEDLAGEKSSAEDLPAEGLAAEGLAAEDWPAEDWPIEDLQARDREPSLAPEGQPPPATPPATTEAPPERLRPTLAAAVPPSSGQTPHETPRPAADSGSFDWERWLGIRGAALLGGIVLALAAILFLRYAIAQGFFPPVVRVALGGVAGLGAVIASQVLRRRGYAQTANPLAGGGVVALYASVWAGYDLYELIPSLPAFALMATITVLCGGLSWVYRSVVIGVLGLAGGFVTPLLLSNLQHQPLSLFGYLLVLDIGLLALSRSRRWPSLAALGLIATTAYQIAWLGGTLGEITLGPGLLILGLFAGAFVLIGPLSPDSEAGGGLLEGWQGVHIGAVVLPFVLILRFADTDLSPHLYPLGSFVLVLGLAAQWLAKRLQEPLLALAAAGGTVGMVTVWTLGTELTRALGWELVAVSLGLALGFHLFFEFFQAKGSAAEDAHEEQETSAPPWLPTAAAEIGLLALAVILPGFEAQPSFWTWLLAWVVLSALLLRLHALGISPLVNLAASALTTFGFLVTGLHRLDPSTGSWADLPAWLFFTVQGICGGLLLLWSRWQEDRSSLHRAPRIPTWSALLYAGGLILLPALTGLLPGFGAPGLLVTASAGTVLALVAIHRLRSPLAFGLLIFELFAFHTLYATVSAVFSYPGGESMAKLYTFPPRQWLLAGYWLLAALLCAWPVLFRRHLGGSEARPPLPGFLRLAALAGPLWLIGLSILFFDLWSDDLLGLVPLALALVAFGVALWIRQLARQGTWLAGDSARRIGLGWMTGSGLALITVGIPLQWREEHLTLGWTALALAVLAFWRRVDHPGLKYLGSGLLVLVTLRLVANPWVLSYHPVVDGVRVGLPVLNWLAYTYLPVAVVLILCGRWLRSREVQRLRPLERSTLYSSARPWLTYGCFLAAGLVTFGWINLTVYDAFTPGVFFTQDLGSALERAPARDLTLSLTWLAYALGLLVLGIRGRSSGLRWGSLVLVLVTVAKVFLYDLGELEDLYRVASLVGLAFSLILISLAYQRFVFRPQNDD